MSVRLSIRLASGILALGLAAMAAGSQAAPGERMVKDTPLAVTAITEEDLREANFGRSVLDVLNAARADPNAYAQTLTRYPGGPAAAAAIRGIAPMGPIRWDDKLYNAASIHAEDIGRAGVMSHTGSDGSTALGRIRAQGLIPTLTAEELSFGQTRPADVIAQLAIDLNVPGAMHRRDLFNPVFTYGGVGCRKHKKLKRVCVIVLTNTPRGYPAPPELPPGTQTR